MRGGALGFHAGLVLLVLLGSLPARADGDDKKDESDGHRTEETVREVTHDESPTVRADLPARLADPDTAYGRVDGDLGVVFGVGTTLNADKPRGAAELRFRYLETAGVFVTYEDSFGARSADPLRVLATGLEVRPLFLGRWMTGRELGWSFADLVIDSLGLEVGAFFQQPVGLTFGARPGLQAGLGLELPILGRASGPWVDVHAGARWSDGVLNGGPINGPSDRALFLSLTLAYHQTFATHMVDLGDRGP